MPLLLGLSLLCLNLHGIISLDHMVGSYGTITSQRCSYVIFNCVLNNLTNQPKQEDCPNSRKRVKHNMPKPRVCWALNCQNLLDRTRPRHGIG